MTNPETERTDSVAAAIEGESVESLIRHAMALLHSCEGMARNSEIPEWVRIESRKVMLETLQAIAEAARREATADPTDAIVDEMIAAVERQGFPPLRPVGEAVRRMVGKDCGITEPCYHGLPHDENESCDWGGHGCQPVGEAQPITERRMEGYYPPDHGHSHVETAGCADETGGRKPCVGEG